MSETAAVPMDSAEITPLAVAGDEQISPLTEWPSGVGGAQCDDCGRTTIVRATETDMLGNPETWQCRPCATGDDRFQYDDFQGDDHA